MRYLILKPPAPVDPRTMEFDSAAVMYEAWPPVVDCELESEAVRTVRMLFVSGVAMPVPVKIGSGVVHLLGIIPDVHAYYDHYSGQIPFALFVQAISQTDYDRRLVKRNEQWSRALWKPPLVQPSGVSCKAEMRSTEVELPVRPTKLIVGRHDGKLALYLELGESKMSLVFENPALEISGLETELDRSSEGDGNVAVNGGLIS